jgi:hypothetical protein
MKSNVLNIEACCVWCRKPASNCPISCDDAGTYSGVLIQGEWRDLDAAVATQESTHPMQSLTAA